ncbi:hypothetical protein IQ227_20085 [Anabaena aphanizomenioides LEGE 00250]|uniref:Uncharacterized protein n=1 Tax=Sphaerospermopsis aphanizomenoides LEGE 00250 TaxID=2777972 RepID=A0ABR9VID7_9CYAN|nr:hypothetical protein [Sphaerospermopsis aphanizomenoides]MBE9238256.1 hypothetical protein [Sphaerospermopsis aphanizomenoides LEGE 00250]
MYFPSHQSPVTSHQSPEKSYTIISSLGDYCCKFRQSLTITKNLTQARDVFVPLN